MDNIFLFILFIVWGWSLSQIRVTKFHKDEEVLLLFWYLWLIGFPVFIFGYCISVILGTL